MSRSQCVSSTEKLRASRIKLKYNQGYCRAVRVGSNISISGTTTTSLPNSHLIGAASAADQTTHIFDIISSALTSLGGSFHDVVRTRISLRDVEDCIDVVKVHGRVFRREGVRPANTTFGGAMLVGEEMKVEIEVDAVVGWSGEVLWI